MKRLSALIVTYNHDEEIGRCLDAALAQGTDDLEVEVVVADNASTDGTRAVLERYGDRIVTVARPTNRGFADGVNAAFAASTGEWVMLLNPDVVMDDGCARALVDRLCSEPQVAIASALLRDPDGSPQRFARSELDLPGVFWSFTEPGRRIDRRWRGGRAARRREYAALWEQGIDRPVAVDCPAAACIVCRRELLPDPPLDPGYPLFFNDGELCRRLRRDGWRIEVTPAATAAHGYSTSIRRADAIGVRAEWVASLRRYMGGTRWRRAAVDAIFLADVLAMVALHALGRGDERLPGMVRGTLGGLGLPGGAAPLLIRPPRRLLPGGASRGR